MKKEIWDDYSLIFPLNDIKMVFSNKQADIKKPSDLIGFSDLVGLNSDNIININQIHSSNVIMVETPGDYNAADGIINEGGNLICSIKVADCLPIYFVNNNTKTIGLVHAGWRGLSQGIINKFADNINKYYENTSDYYALIGPSIQSCCFEIKDDVLSFFDSRFYKQIGHNKYKVNLQEWALNQLMDVGIAKKNISVINKCTYCLDTIYHSYRRSGSATGRMYALLGWSN
ncbi:MAG: hypothetical protein CBD77_04590 [bacterium TMED217]|nr:MAG: hypothetical protein CBD77_04590 [bacterium TMED217]|tara:strand:- start:15224 stop:15913 length:690 start_codon:yes stop_codon:yes gene_type:complete